MNDSPYYFVDIPTFEAVGPAVLNGTNNILKVYVPYVILCYVMLCYISTHPRHQPAAT
jgi:hypothetical protein